MIYVKENNNRQKYAGNRDTQVRQGSCLFYEQVRNDSTYDSGRHTL